LTITEICLVILTIAIASLSVFLISMVAQIRKSAKEVETVLKNVDEELTPLLSKLRETIENIQHISSQVDSGITTTANALKTIENTVRNLSQASSFLSAKSLARKVIASGIWIGIKAGFGIVKKRFSSKKK